MNTRTFNKKLTLRKETISHLAPADLKKIKGGIETLSCDTFCLNCPTITLCVPTLATCYPTLIWC